MTPAAPPAMPPIATIDVSMAPAGGALRRAALVAWDLALVTLLVLALPLVVVIGAPLAFLALVGVMIVQRVRAPRA